MLWCAIGAFLSDCFLSGAVLINDWRLRSPLPTASHLRDVAYGNNRFVAVGERGTVLLSSDAFTWQEHIEPTNNFDRIAFGRGLFAATGSAGISTSSDGINWRRAEVPGVNNLVYAGGLFIGVGNGFIVSSPDGVTWVITATEAPPISYSDTYLNGITHGNGLFVATGSQFPSDPESHAPPLPVVLTSTNGSNWTSRKAGPLAYPGRVVFGNNTFVTLGATGRIWYSSDAENWVEAETGTGWNNYYDIEFGNGVFVAVGVPMERRIRTSPDGRVWSSQNTDAPSFYQGITYGMGRFVAVGAAGGVIESRNGTNWITRSQGFSPRLFDCIHADGRFVAVGGVNVGSFILVSEDGYTWRAQGFPEIAYLGGVAYGGGKYVAGGSSGSLFVSADGVSWSFHKNSDSSWDFGRMTYANGLFVAVGGNSFRTGGILTSTNGIDWIVRYAATDEFLSDIIYAKGMFVAVGGDILSVANPSTILTSADGVTWTHRDAGLPSSLSGIAYGNGTFVAVRYAGLTSEVVLTSTDGMAWTTRSLSSYSPLTGVAFGEGLFLAYGLNGSLFTSINGVTWSTLTGRTRQDIWGAAYGNGTFVAVGEGGTIVQTASPIPRIHAEQTRVSDDGFLRTIIETPSKWNFVVEKSSDFEFWRTIETVTNSPGLIEISDPAPRGTRNGFYRVKQR